MPRGQFAVASIVALALGCGRVGYDLEGEDRDASAGLDGSVPADAAGLDAAPVDAAGLDAATPDASRTDGGGRPPDLGPFGPGRRIEVLSSIHRDSDPTCTADLRELYFTSQRPGGTGSLDIWVSRRSSAADPWGAPEEVAELNTIDHEQTPEISPDGLTLYLASNRAGSPPRYDIYVSTRATRGDPWGAPELVTELDAPENRISPTPSADGLRMMFHIDETGDTSILETTRASPGGTFATPVLVASLNTPWHEGAPFPWNDALTVVFDSNRPTGEGSWDLFVATRPSLDEPFGEPTPIAELNDVGKQSAPWVSPDGGYILYTHSDLASEWNEDVWEAFR